MSVQLNTVPLDAPFKWLGQGWRLFKEQSGLWMMMFFFIFASLLFSSLLGAIGMVIYALVHPFLVAGFYHLAFKANHQIRGDINEFFVAFKDQQVVRIFIQLGLLSLVVSLLTEPLTRPIVQAISEGTQADQTSIALLVLAQGSYWLFTFFAIPIAYFHHEQRLFTVLMYSFNACMRNIVPLLLFAFVSMLLFFFSFVLTLGLALIVVLPWLMITSYLAFHDIIGADLVLDSPIDEQQSERRSDDDNDDDMTMSA